MPVTLFEQSPDLNLQWGGSVYLDEFVCMLDA